MESAANLHLQRQLQDQLLAPPPSSSSLPITSCFGLGSTHAWSPNAALNTCNYNPRIFNGVTTIPIRDCGQKSTSNLLTSSLNSSMVQDLGFQWGGVNSGSFFSQSLHDQQAGKIKEEMSAAAESFPKFTEMLNSRPSCTNQDFDQFSSTNHVKNNNDPPAEDLNDLSHKLLIKTLISSGCQINGGLMKAGEFYNTARNRGHFSQIYPSINVSNWNLSSQAPAFSNSLDLNLQTPADMLTSGGNFSHSQDNFGIFKEALPDFHDQMQQPPPSLPCIPSKMTPFSSEVTEAKRPCNSMEPRVNQQTHPPPKKMRLDSRAPCPPFKVRKEKLGDRIAALQQLVAPFGKTDTASVLMEAIGYIKFLQNQVETLSVPYMKPSCNKTSKPTHQSPAEDANEGPPTRDLRSRGLCLVPLGCLSYVTGDGGGGGIWPPPGFNGGTS